MIISYYDSENLSCTMYTIFTNTAKVSKIVDGDDDIDDLLIVFDMSE